MARVGIAVDDWKLPTFRRVLTEAGYTYHECPGLTFETSMLYVETNDTSALQVVVMKCQTECRRSKMS